MAAAKNVTTPVEEKPSPYSMASTVDSAAVSDATRRQNSDGKDGSNRRTPIDLTTMPTRQYLDITVIPIIMEGMQMLDLERPPDPVSSLAAFLLRHKEEYERAYLTVNTPSSKPDSPVPSEK